MAMKILSQALSLSKDDRRRVAERLLDSVARQADESVEEAWDQEVLRRVEAAERGETQARPWDEASCELRAKYARR